MLFVPNVIKIVCNDFRGFNNQSLGFIKMIDCMTWGSLFLLVVWAFVVYKMFQLKEETPEVESEESR